MNPTTRSVINRTFIILGSLASILGLLALLLTGSALQITSIVVAICLFLASTLALLWRTLSGETANRYPHGRKVLASFARYSTEDANLINYDIYRMVQVKRTVMTHYTHNFYWTGSEPPKLNSDLQKVEEVVQTEKGIYDKIILRLDQAKLYNESTIIHIRMTLDDSDHKSETHVAFKIDEPTEILQWDIELRYKDDTTPPAILERRALSSDLSSGYEEIKKVPFDKATKTYQYSLPKPEVGFHYRLRWARL